MDKGSNFSPTHHAEDMASVHRNDKSNSTGTRSKKDDDALVGLRRRASSCGSSDKPTAASIGVAACEGYVQPRRRVRRNITEVVKNWQALSMQAEPVMSSGNFLTVPNACVPKSLSLANLCSSAEECAAVAAACQARTSRAVSMPSSPTALLGRLVGCDSVYGSFGTDSQTSLGRAVSESSAEVTQTLDMDPGAGSSRRHLRCNSSDSAVIVSCEDDRGRPSSLMLSPDSVNSPTDSEGSLFSLLRAPAVVVSDHSNSDIQQLLKEIPRSEPPTGDFPGRKLSDCSSCSSWTSTISADEDETEEKNLLLCEFHGPSGWRKVRNVVHWSPFIQTYKKQKYPWVQLAGHQGSFKPGGHGTILKKFSAREEWCLLELMDDELRPFVPYYKGHVAHDDGEDYLQLQDLLGGFENPCVMDCKIGVRTYLEEELAKAKEKPRLRKDMYEKMIQVDPQVPTEEEHRLRGVTKPRYMVWRETISSTATLGFRIEGMKKRDGASSKDYKTVRSGEQVTSTIREFVNGCETIIPRYIERLKDIQKALGRSQFFATHELIGSSLLFVHDQEKASVWMIDFAKTHPLPPGVSIDHHSAWVVGNHEDGYLLGLENLMDVFQVICNSKLGGQNL